MKRTLTLAGATIAVLGSVPAPAQISFITPQTPPKPKPRPAPVPAKATPRVPAKAISKPAPVVAAPTTAMAKAVPPPRSKEPTPARSHKQAAASSPAKPGLPSGSVQVPPEGTGLLIGGQPVMLAGLAVRSTPELQGRLTAWLARNGSTVRCSPQGNRYQCATPYGSDLGGALIVSGFAVPEPDASPTYQALAAAVQLRASVAGNDPGPALSSVLAGTANLSCESFGCRTRYTFRGYGRANAAIDRQDWKGLAESIVSVNYPNDINFYYLGRTAEAMGAYSAAATYYSKALSLFQSPDPNGHCSSLQGLPACGGIDLGQQLPALIQGTQRMSKFEM